MDGTDRGRSYAMERLGEVRIVGRLVTVSTGSRRISKLSQVRCGNQTRVRGRMTGCTGAAVNIHNHIGARVTACCTISVNGDRGVTQAAAVRRMVVHVVNIRHLIRMTIQTMNGIETRIGTQGYCINNLWSCALVTG